MQKFPKGALVRIAKDLGSSMSHFTADADAIVLGSYAEQYGGSDTKSYTLHLKGRGSSSWYYEHQLTLISLDQEALLEQWKSEEELRAKQQSDLDWIFRHATEVLNSASGATVGSLAQCMGITNLWGSRGEGITYYHNALAVLSYAKPFLLAGDKAGWLSFCEEIRKYSTVNASKKS